MGRPKGTSSPAVLVTAYKPDMFALDGRFYGEKKMNKRHHVKLVHEGSYVAEVDIELIDTEGGWSPYLSLEDAEKLDDVREALRREDIPTASNLARVYRLTPATK